MPNWDTRSPTTPPRAAPCHRPGRDHRHRGPPARLRRADPRHRRQPRLRVHRLAQDRRPGARPAPGPRARPLRPPRRPPPASRPRPAATPGTALAVLAGVLDRDGQQHSATQTRNQALADADHLALLHAIWAAETTAGPRPALPRPAHEQPAARLPPGARPPGQVAVADPARRRTGRPGPRRASWPTRSPNGTWPDPATSPPSSTPASGTASAPWSRSRPGRGRSRSPPSPTPNAAPTSPRSPR